MRVIWVLLKNEKCQKANKFPTNSRFVAYRNSHNSPGRAPTRGKCRERKKKIISFFVSCLFYSYICTCYLPDAAMMSSVDDGVDGWSTTYWKALRRFVFGRSKLPQIEQRTKTNAEVTPRGVLYTLRSVLRGYFVPSMHTLRVSIYSNVGVSLSVFLWGCGRPWTTNRQ